MVKAVIFDMDGVLIDSIELGFQARKKLLARYNVELDAVPDPQGESHRAASIKSLLTSVKDHSGIHIDHDEFAELSRKHMREALKEYGAAADPGLIAFLEELKQHHITCAVVSSSLREGIAIKLDMLGLRQYFPIIITGSDTQAHKPHPEPYLTAIKKLGLSPQDCIIFEDSLTGIQAGLAAGCRVIGFTQYNMPAEPLPGVAAIVKTWGEMNYSKLQQLLATIN